MFTGDDEEAELDVGLKNDEDAISAYFYLRRKSYLFLTLLVTKDNDRGRGWLGRAEEDADVDGLVVWAEDVDGLVASE
ncbi:hypothetical protein THAOC_22005, partial [Thalassiosira oceanica]